MLNLKYNQLLCDKILPKQSEHQSEYPECLAHNVSMPLANNEDNQPNPAV